MPISTTTVVEIELQSNPRVQRTTGDNVTNSSAGDDQSGNRGVESESESANVATAVPDGGYGWIVVFSCSVITFHFNGLTGSWGVLQSHLLESDLQGVSTSTITFVGTLALSLVVAFGLVGNRLAQLMGARMSALAGVAILGLAEIISGSTTSHIGGLFGTSGVMAGIGTCFLYSVTNSLPTQYFSSKLGTANGLVKLGGGIGATVFAIVLEVLIQEVGIGWTFRILGFITLSTGLPAAWLIKERAPSRNTPFFELSMFRNPAYTAIAIAAALATFTLFAPPYFLPIIAHSVGLSSSTGAGLVAGFNACTAVGRLISGPACDKLGSINTFLIMMALSAISMLAIWPFSNNLGLLVVFAMLNGVANGSFFVTMPTVLATMFGPGRAPVAMGQAITGWTVGYLMGAPIAGYLLQATSADKSGSIDPYRPAIFYAGGMALLSCVFVLLARLATDRKLLKRV
ncbi:hypothetical protein LTR36_005982 [Oleoguttula mirabilis]|uniref:Major facilitator superfamily (MFS) profile domain-containing protein n=1 Tax=Oleoguttula mirabilis TaxID=1507867 RepID=A0AAV9JCM0_9PEZI|nr:hypothetical protein LTR36_005982 [Oleoguttula mirabilis]